MLNHPSSDRASRRRVLLLLTELVAVGAFVVALAPLASAQSTDPGPRAGDHDPPHLTDAQKTCLTQHGVQLPANGQKPSSPPSAQQRQAFAAAAQACGIPQPTGHPHAHPHLTDAQKTCLTQHGIRLPPNGQKPSSPPSAQQRQAFTAAAQACGTPTPKDRPAPSSS